MGEIPLGSESALCGAADSGALVLGGGSVANIGHAPDRELACLSSSAWMVSRLNARRVMPGVISPLRVRCNLSIAAPLLMNCSVEWMVGVAG